MCRDLEKTMKVVRTWLKFEKHSTRPVFGKLWPLGQIRLSSAFVNNILLEQSHTHSFSIACGCSPLHWQSWAVETENI